MGWALGGFGLLVVFLIVAGASVILCRRRYGTQWQWGTRDVVVVCEEWRRKVAWIWAPREEKVGLVKAQQPTCCHPMMPGLYRQNSGNSSQYIMHSDSDLRLDAQGAFTRFEAVDRDLHSPPSPSSIGIGMPPTIHETMKKQQTSPVATTSTTSSSIVKKIPAQPLRPAAQPAFRTTARPRPSPLKPPTSVPEYLRLRECEPTPPTPPPPPSLAKLQGRHHRGMFVFSDDSNPPPPLPPPPPRAPDVLAVALAHADMLSRTGSGPAYEEEAEIQLRNSLFDIPRIPTHNPFEEAPPPTKIRYSVQGAVLSDNLFDEDDAEPPYGSYDIVHHHQSRDLDSIFSPPMRRVPSTRNLQDLERITRYIQSLPDAGHFYDDQLFGDEMEDEDDEEEPRSPAAPPPPPAPPDKEHSQPTTGEKIFKALRAVTSQSYIDASEFYNSIVTSAQQVHNSLAFHSRSNSTEDEQHENPSFTAFIENELPQQQQQPPPPARKSSADLYNPELNQEAQRTAQEVYNSLQDPPASPLLLLKDEQHQQQQQQPSHEAYSSYLQTDPSFTRTSEDIFNSLEQRRKSVLNDMLELEACESERRRNSQEFLNALEEVQMKRRLSQLFEEQPFDEILLNNPNARRGSLDSLLQSIEDLTNLRRAISCESVCSDTSVTLNDETQVVGLICVGLEHDRYPNFNGESDLIVSILEARDLIAADGRAAVNTFAKVCLLPDRENFTHTRVYKDTNSPSYQEKFYFTLTEPPLARSLLVEVFSYELPSNGCSAGEAQLLGEAQLRLNPTPRPPATMWLPLVMPELPQQLLGELMFSLSYLPTAERLTLVVVKARNLRGASEQPGDFFVKVYLLQQGKKLHKKRTTIKRGEKSPIFNEAIIFNVQAHALQNVQLRLTVAEVSSDVSTKAYSVGHVLVGATTTGRALTHWRQMLGSLRRPVAMWHPLFK